MTRFDDDTPFWDEPDWSGIADAPRPRRTYGERTRTHHVVAHRAPLPPLERSRDADFWAEDWPDDADPGEVDAWVEPVETTAPRVARRHRAVGVDPRLLRLGGLAAAIVLMVPIALALRDGGGGGELRSAGAQSGAESTTTAAPSLRADAGAGHRRSRQEPRAAKQSPSAVARTKAPPATETEANADVDLGGEVMAAAVADEPACAGEYTVAAGDYWVRFAESSGAELSAWLNANGATAETPLYAGDVLCVPAGAATPEPPPSTTDAPETTPAPTTTETPATTPPTDAPTTTDPPATEPPTTAPPTTDPPTTTPAPPDPIPAGNVEAIIRSIWPDDIEDRALVIAQRESSLQPDAYNGWCCYGLFQIYFDANRSFLASLGVTSAQQLLDARTNATVAYAMYLRSGWGPWATTDPG